MTINPSNHSSERAFTLIELLVVISIIALMIGILMPVLKNARVSAQRTKCAAHLKNIGIGWVAYADDFPEGFPNAVSLPSPVATAPPGELTIMKVLDHHIEAPNVYACPSDDRGYFAERATSYEYLVGLAIALDPTNAAVMAEWARKSPDLVPVLADAEPFHPAPHDLDRRQTVYHDAHVDWLFENLPTNP